MDQPKMVTDSETRGVEFVVQRNNPRGKPSRRGEGSDFIENKRVRQLRTTCMI